MNSYQENKARINELGVRIENCRHWIRSDRDQIESITLRKEAMEKAMICFENERNALYAKSNRPTT